MTETTEPSHPQVSLSLLMDLGKQGKPLWPGRMTMGGKH